MSLWGAQDVRALQAYWPHCSRLELAKLLGGRHSTAAIRTMAWKLGLRKDPAVARETRTRWNPGHRSP